jgi:hypothetical protein
MSGNHGQNMNATGSPWGGIGQIRAATAHPVQAGFGEVIAGAGK